MKTIEQSNILLIDILHFNSLFTNLIFNSKLLKKSYYLYYNNQIVNLFANNSEISLIFI